MEVKTTLPKVVIFCFWAFFVLVNAGLIARKIMGWI